MDKTGISTPRICLLARNELVAWLVISCVVCTAAALPHASEGLSGGSAVQVAAVSIQAKAAPTWRLDLNSATAAELEMLPGIGPRRAKWILQERHKRGSFSTVWDLGTVPGLSRTLIQRMEPLVRAAAPRQQP